jgi:rhodanese-related sulfurtransferase
MPAMGKLSETLALAQERARSLGLPYAGALTPREAWDVLQLAPGSKLVDVRTRAEWDWVGRVPGAIEIEWMLYPGNEPNAHFLAHFKRQVDPEALVMFLCRSGARSNAAATLAAGSAHQCLQHPGRLRRRQGRQRAPQQGRGLAPCRPAVDPGLTPQDSEMQAVPISFDRFNALSDGDAHERIRAARARLGDKAVLLCHHYQRADVYQYADLTGDSLKLSRLAAETDAEYIVFCGVHFMAEVADIMSKPHQQAILPDLAAGCSMADMANLAKVERCWRELTEVLETPDALITPVTYINSAADLKAFCGEHGGIVCTSTNAPTILDWAFAQRERCCSSPTSTWAAGPASTRASRWTRWTRWWSGTRTSNSAA